MLVLAKQSVKIAGRDVELFFKSAEEISKTLSGFIKIL
jgi:hypothetical protein